jgi:DNA-binding transcriptional LysR family regulator
VICAAPSYLAQNPAPERPEDLGQHNCLTYRHNLGRPVWRFIAPDRQHTEVAVTGSLQVDTGMALVSSARAGLGIILMPDWSVREELKSGQLIRLFPDYQVTHTEYENGIYAVFEKSRYMSGKIRVFVDYIATVMREKLG